MIPVNAPLLDGNEKKYLDECLATGWISSEGPFIARFEEKMAAAVQRRHGIAVCNGTAALEVAVAALNLQPGDEVLLPTFTIISCAAAIVRRGCVPLGVDCEASTWNIDVAKLRQRLEDEIDRKGNRRIKAIMVVHIYGLPSDLDPILALAKKYDLKIIEDAAEMHGQTYRGRPCGSFGDVSVFSFYPNKHVTTGEGGMLVTDDDAIAARCRSLRNLCFQPERRFVHEELGYNFRMTNLQAALGLAQLERLDESVQRKRRMGSRYRELLGHVAGLELQAPRADYADNIYWVFGVVLGDAFAFDAAEAMRRLGARGVGTRPFFWPMHEQPVFAKMGLFAGERHPVAERIARRGFYLPSGLALTDAQAAEVAAIFTDVIKS
jgi:perosamine synthetase